MDFDGDVDWEDVETEDDILDEIEKTLHPHGHSFIDSDEKDDFDYDDSCSDCAD